MRVLLINPTMGDYYQGAKVRAAITLSPPLNLALLAGALRQAGHHVAVWDEEAEDLGDLEARLRAERPDLVGVSFRTPLFDRARRIAEAAARACPSALRVAGGVHASTLPEDCLERAPFDVAVRGEGEGPLLELADGRSFSNISGITWNSGSTPARALLPELDALSFGAWELFDLRRYQQTSLVARVAPVADLEFSRGCRARCIYCTKGVFGDRWRAKSAERFVDEIEHARAAGFRAFNLVDDSFTTITSQAIAACEELLRRGVRMPWTLTNGLRVANVNEEFFRLARRAGCELLAFGFESGSDEMLRRIKKGATVRQARRAVAWARKYGFTILGYFMVGLPGETPQSLRETAEFAASLDLDYAKFSIAMPLPGTPLYEQWRPWIQEHQTAFSIHRPGEGRFQHPEWDWPTLEAHTRQAYRVFYGRPRYAARRLLRAWERGVLARDLGYTAALGATGLMQAFGRR